jgi:signal transduction histidine kinase/CheY-like chemotaxis protein
MALVAIAVSALSSFAQQTPAVITNAKDLLDRPAGQATGRIAVRLRGVVTHLGVERNVLFVQDATGGVRVTPGSHRPDLRAGDLVELEGFFNRSQQAPAVLPTKIQVVGRAPFPDPLRVPVSQIVRGVRDAQWVEVSGIVRSILVQKERTIAEVAVGDERVTVHLPPGGDGYAYRSLVDADVRVQGVCAARLNSDLEFVEAVVLVPEPDLIEAERPASLVRWDSPTVPLNSALAPRSPGRIGHRIHVRGTVELFRPGASVFVTDGTSHLYVETAGAEPLLPGDLVDILGFPELVQKAPGLVDSAYRRISAGVAPAPKRVTPSQLLDTHFDSALISVEGILRDSSFPPDGPELTIESGTLAFQVLFAAGGDMARLERLERGSLLRVTGVCILFRDDDAHPYGLKLRAREANDIELLQGPSWWTVQHTVTLLVAVGVVATALISALALSLRRRVRNQAAMIQREVEHKLSLADQLRQSQKMEAIGQLAGGVAHDFNNLLTVINGYSDVLLGEFERDDPRRQDVTMIAEAGIRAAALTSQLLAFSRKQVVQPKVMDVNEAVRHASGILDRLIGEDVRLVLRGRADSPFIVADPGQFQQVVINLAVNARDAMPQGGTLTIDTANVQQLPATGSPQTDPTGGLFVRIAVTDTGTGMDPATQARVFEPFFTTKEVGKGTGLGLSTVYGIAQQCGGHVMLDSELGLGTTFTLYFPAVPPPTEASPGPNVGRLDRGATQQATILVVEDEASVRELMTRTLRQRGYMVLDAPSAAAALEIARAFSGPIDLLVTDVIMPEMSGKVLADRLTVERTDIRALFVSGYTDDAVVRHGVANSSVAFLQKPFTADVLARKVRDTLDHPQAQA